jgi:hypothetical protein
MSHISIIPQVVEKGEKVIMFRFIFKITLYKPNRLQLRTLI